MVWRLGCCPPDSGAALGETGRIRGLVAIEQSVSGTRDLCLSRQNMQGAASPEPVLLLDLVRQLIGAWNCVSPAARMSSPIQEMPAGVFWSQSQVTQQICSLCPSAAYCLHLLQPLSLRHGLRTVSISSSREVGHTPSIQGATPEVPTHC